MNILILSTSPRKSFSTSLYFSKILKLYLLGNKVQIISLKTACDYNKALSQLENIDALIFSSPVYVDTLPSTTLAYLNKLQQHILEKQYKFNVYTLTNCGFYEGHQCALAINTIELWCERSALSFKGGIGIGSGVMLGFIRLLPLIGLGITAAELAIHAILLLAQGSFSVLGLFAGFIPLNFIIQTAVWLLFSLGAFVNIFKLKRSIIKEKYLLKYTTAWFCPRFLFIAMASFYWVLRGIILHGVMPWKLFKKDTEAENIKP